MEAPTVVTRTANSPSNGSITTKRKTRASSSSSTIQPAQRRKTYTKRVKVDAEYLKNTLVPYVKRHRPRAVTEEGRADIVMVVGHLKNENLERSGFGKGARHKNPLKKAAKMLRRDINVVSAAWKDFVEHGTMNVADAPVNVDTGSENTRFPRTPELRSKVQKFLRDQRELGAFTSALTVLDFLEREGVIQYDKRSRKAYKAASRAVQRYVESLGFMRGKKKGKIGYKLSEKNELLRAEYVQRMKANREAPVGQRRRVISQDESYIHDNYQRSDSLYDPQDDMDVHRKEKPRGRRFCFIGAIVGPDLNVEEDKRTEEQKARWLPGSFDIFLGGKRKVSKMVARARGQQRQIKQADRKALHVQWCQKFGLPTTNEQGASLDKDALWRQLLEYEKENPQALLAESLEGDGGEDNKEPAGVHDHLKYTGKFNHAKTDTKDYHGMFDHDYMVQWMEAFLKSLEDEGLANTLIVMDNAAYHKHIPKDIPRGSNKKEKIVAALQKYGIQHDPNANKPVLYQLLKEYVDKNVPPVLVQMANDAGHELIFSPPHNSDLQPIELIWAIVKQAVARQYTRDTTLDEVFQRLNQAFDSLKPRQVQGCYNKTLKMEIEILEHLEKLDAMDEEARELSDVEEASSDMGEANESE